MKFRVLNQYYSLREIWKLRHAPLNLLLSPAKILNFLLVGLSQTFKSTRVFGTPVTLMVEASSRCDMACAMCPIILHQTKRVKGDLSLAGFKKVIDEIGGRLSFLMMWNFGEPLLNRETFEMVSYAKARRIFVVMSTNALSLNDEKIARMLDSGLDYLIVSFDGASAETYERYRGKGNYEKVLGNVRNLVAARNARKAGSPFINLQFIVMKDNEHEVGTIRALAKELGVDKLSLKKFTYIDPQSTAFLPKNKEYVHGKYKNGPRPAAQCARPWQSSVVPWNGDVLPCCGDLEFKYVFGNIHSSPFGDIWNNGAYRLFRTKLLADMKQIDICRACPGENFTTDMFIE